MGELTYPTDLDLAGPWLVTAEQLEALDEIVERQCEALQTSVESRISKLIGDAAAFEPRLIGEGKLQEENRQLLRSHAKKQPNFRLQRGVEISLKDGKKLSGRTFKEASAHPEVDNSRVVQLGMELSDGETTCSFSLGGRWSNSLRLSVSGKNQPDRERLFIALRNWVRDCQAPGWQRAWNWLASNQIQWVVWSLAMGLSAILTFIFAWQGDPQYINAAHNVLDKGLESKDLTKALELILALQSHYQPKSTPTGTPMWLWLVTFGGLAICIALSIHPGLEVGLGKGKARIRFWKTWMHLVLVTVPLFFVTTVARNIISSVIGKIF